MLKKIMIDEAVLWEIFKPKEHRSFKKYVLMYNSSVEDKFENNIDQPIIPVKRKYVEDDDEDGEDEVIKPKKKKIIPL
jgi:hypothetical protein